MANEGIEVPIDGNPTGFKRAMQDMMQSARDGAKGVEASFGSLQNVFAGVQGKIAAMGAVLAGGAVFKAAVDETVKMTTESIKLASTLGISATEASILNVALGDIYQTGDTVIAATGKITKTLRENEGAFSSLGVATRESNGHFRNSMDIMLDTNKALLKFREGTDRNIEGQKIYGKQWAEIAPLLKLNTDLMEQSKKKAEALGLVIGVENVEATAKYRAAMNDVGDVINAQKKAISDALLPILTDLGNWYADTGPQRVQVMKKAMAGLISAFYGVKMVVEGVWEVIKAFVQVSTVHLLRFADAASHALRGDFAGAKEAWQRGGDMISEISGKAWDNIVADAEKNRDKIFKVWFDATEATPTATKRNKGGTGSSGGGEEKDKKGPESYMQYYEGALEEEKRLAAERDALRGYTKEQELAFWQMLLTNADLKEKDRLAITRKISGLIVDIKRNEAKQLQELDGEGIRSGEALALGRVEAERAAAQVSLDLNQMTKAQFLALEESFEQQRFEIQRTALEQRMELLSKDPNTNPVEFARIKNQILELEQQHNIKRIQIQGQMAVESGQIWANLGDRIGGLWDQGMQALMNGTLTWRNAMRAVGAQVVAWFATDVVGKQVKIWLLGEAAKTGATQTGTALRLATESGAALKSVGIWAMAGIKNIMISAWEAMAAVYKSIAAIPGVGPIMAPVMAGAAFVTVAGFAKNIASAEGGYDIPAGVNPLTQLHQKEMVLPEENAEVIRGLAKSGSSASGDVHLHVHTQSTQDFQNFLKRNSHTLAPSLRALARNFTPAKV